jgi:hypothetical protein
MSILINVWNVGRDELRAKRHQIRLVLWTRKIKELENPIDLAGQSLRAIVFIHIAWLNNTNMSLGPGPHMDASLDSLFFRRFPQGLRIPPFGLHAGSRMGIKEFLIEIGIPEGVADHSVALRV